MAGARDSSGPDWFLHEWAALRGKRQADLISDLGFLKNQAFRIWHSRQPYRRDILNRVAAWLEVEPYELLMQPARAMALKQLEASARVIAANSVAPSLAEAAEPGAPPFDHRRDPKRRSAM